ncbi:hypothetical protein PISMIDRAFT_680122, partial [Pisolithus microcarpus 441]
PSSLERFSTLVSKNAMEGVALSTVHWNERSHFPLWLDSRSIWPGKGCFLNGGILKRSGTERPWHTLLCTIDAGAVASYRTTDLIHSAKGITPRHSDTATFFLMTSTTPC